MTVGSDVKQCLASLKGVEASLSSLAYGHKKMNRRKHYMKR